MIIDFDELNRPLAVCSSCKEFHLLTRLKPLGPEFSIICESCFQNMDLIERKKNVLNVKEVEHRYKLNLLLLSDVMSVEREKFNAQIQELEAENAKLRRQLRKNIPGNS